jgi:hypothetical protein
LVSGGGTTDNTGLALSAIDQTAGGNTSHASARADLSTGALGVVSASDLDPNFASGNRATAEYLDTLHFSFPGAGPSTITDVTSKYPRTTQSTRDPPAGAARDKAIHALPVELLPNGGR